jgi:hypothetical protein
VGLALLSVVCATVLVACLPHASAAERVKFPSNCRNFTYKPRSVVVACGDGNFQLRKMRWRRWNRQEAIGHGVGLVNDCMPYCALGHFHRYFVRVRLYSAHRCALTGTLQFRKLAYDFPRAHPSGLTRGKQPFTCADETV